MNRVFAVLLVLLFASLSGAQNYSAKIMDTVESGSDKIILFENHTWEYVSYDKRLSNSPFDSFWDNEQIFAYLNKKTPYPEYVEIDLNKPSDSFTMPIVGKIWGGFSKYHPGMDLELKKGDPVKAAFEGKVRYAQYNRGGYGFLVIIRHYNGLETYYAHLSEIWVTPNQVVKSGDVIGLGGSTGRSKGAHLHFEVRYLDKALDPTSLIDFNNKKLIVSKLVLDKHSMEYYDHYKPAAQQQNVPNTGQLQDNGQGQFYTIRSGDTLSGIAKRNGTTVKAICALNNITSTTTLKIGKKIRIR